MGIDKPKLACSLYHGLIQAKTAPEIIIPTNVENMDILPANTDLIGFEVEMMASRGREEVLKRLLSGIKQNYDFLLLDCPPSLSLLTLNALTAADSVLIPLQSEFFALEGLGQLLATIKRVKLSLNQSLKIKGILLTMFDRRTNLARQVVEDAETHFKEMIFKTRIPRNVKLGEAPSFGMPVIAYDPSSLGAKSYLDLAKELLQR
jgi:chromosome partitioning protein